MSRLMSDHDRVPFIDEKRNLIMTEKLWWWTGPFVQLGDWYSYVVLPYDPDGYYFEWLD